ncbi:UDP-glucose 4-epimerase [Pseudomonas fluorescens]|jgi:UDP-glucose 4-epimerase|uniref:UDP-glucose 4-epimerase n=1 Tax=Pseudomonas fluorescens TaxID=294 RepID=A0A2N1E923_PSEFL|nr:MULTISPECIES: NAD-dependent epimerase/dehydratase family protein [Pseudomonas]RYF64565.1 MAG: UDP-glucose 4-epimerase [Cytophagaceae bacterium]MBD8098816.1 UDP-glucose 4-epimerase [Pseudomonas fluorescens]MBD8775286.1 UDP-glucose 4-epimerase [Pseudomonas fluorescens]MBD8780472.1 UDP-glucose 4-epimerase [Pseudomonas fluorescens]MBD8797726.1 UDP-glucose 4-epimerase [Pseudomonas fluorescens]
MKILITGGAGYIGSTICLALADAGHHPVILDEQPCPTEKASGTVSYYQGDISDRQLLTQIAKAHPDLSLVVHCAAKIDVAESITQPDTYYENNFSKSVSMVNHLLDLGVNKLILSGTAALYSADNAHRFDEHSNPVPMSPYARSKYFLELALKDISNARDFQFLTFRYFNPIGSDHSFRTGFRGDNKSSLLNSLIQCAASRKPFQINGTDWNTRDGSTVRDFVDVADLAAAHVLAALAFNNNSLSVPLNRFGMPVINLGSERGVTVEEFVLAFMSATKSELVVNRAGRRPGDIIGGYASSKLARELLGWAPSTPLQTSILNSIRWATTLNK